CPEEVEASVRALADWLMQAGVTSLREFLTISVRSEACGSSREDALYWLLTIDNLEGVSGRKIRSPMVAQQQRPPSLWGGSEASTEWGFPPQTSGDRSVPETGARQMYRCGSCGGNFPSLPFRVAANALHRSGHHLQQLMSGPISAQLLLPGMCPLRGGSAEDRYRLIRACSQCYQLHLALEDLAEVAKASAAALG
ncbi:hypothetical protein FOZ62_016757, partial [Perkinsus olseni]